ncbi:unnamed protein product [Danaus chrysippus]|uniref:(African queen) hypothetical protein n=1 Tax=Danaus chrysippus TaxID=151541 RepID=A0A8J2W3W6_9NEOP|nr:unnamed protein product [Danaus chrysippus]
MMLILCLVLLSNVLLEVESDSRVRLLNHTDYVISVIQETVKRVERLGFYNLKIEELSITINQTVLGERFVGEAKLKNGFVTSIQSWDLIQHTVQQVWPSATPGIVEIRSTLRFINMEIGFDLEITTAEGKHISTATIIYPETQFSFTISKNLFRDKISTNVVSVVINPRTSLTLLPENSFTKLLPPLEVVKEIENEIHWCNLKLDDINQFVNTSYYNWRVLGPVNYTNGFTISVQDLSVLNIRTIFSTINENGSEYGNVFMEGTLRLSDLKVGFDVKTNFEDSGEHHFTSVHEYGTTTLLLRLNHNLLTNETTSDAGIVSIPRPRDIRNAYLPKSNITEVLSRQVILSSTKHNDKQLPYTFLKPWLGEGLLTSNETAIPATRSEGIQTITQKYFKSIHTVGEAVVERICRVWLYFDPCFKLTKTAKEQETALKELHTFTNKIIADRKEFIKNFDVTKYIDSDEYDNSKGKLTMLDLLLENEKTGNIDLESIREEVDTFMFEGHDTTAMALSYFIMAIANEPEIQQKIYEEMEQIFGDSKRLATMADLNEMRYLECCIKESLRLYPSVPFIARNLTQDTVLSGYTVPANTFVHLFIYDLHRRPDLFPDPERFIPERFLPENCLNRHPYAYIPFSAGSRNCIGQKFAMLEMKTVLSSLIRQFHIEPVTKPSELRFRTDLVLRPTHPIYVKFKNRE